MLGRIHVDPEVGEGDKQVAQRVERRECSVFVMADPVLNDVFDQQPDRLDQKVQENQQTDICEKAFDGFWCFKTGASALGNKVKINEMYRKEM